MQIICHNVIDLEQNCFTQTAKYTVVHMRYMAAIDSHYTDHHIDLHYLYNNKIILGEEQTC